MCGSDRSESSVGEMEVTTNIGSARGSSCASVHYGCFRVTCRVVCVPPRGSGESVTSADSVRGVLKGRLGVLVRKIYSN